MKCYLTITLYRISVIFTRIITERRSAWRSSRHLLPITIQERDNLPARAVDVRAESGIARAVRDSVRHSPTDCAFIIRSGRDIPEGNLTA